MRQTKAQKFIDEYCRTNGIKLLIDPKLGKNDGLCYPAYKEIHLASTYSSSQVRIAVFCHEVGHIICDRFKHKPYNIFEGEYMAWGEGMKLYNKHFGKSFSKTQAEFMLKCLKSYCKSQYEFKKQTGKKQD